MFVAGKGICEMTNNLYFSSKTLIFYSRRHLFYQIKQIIVTCKNDCASYLAVTQ